MSDSLFLDSIKPLFADISERFSGESQFDAAGAWSELVATGFLRLMLPEQDEGAGLDVTEGLPVLMAAGYCALPLPYAETALLYAAQPTLAADDQALAVGLSTTAGRAKALRQDLPYLQALLLDTAGGAERAAVSDSDSGNWTLQGIPSPCETTINLQLLGTAAECLQLAGALQRVLELTVDYANTRQQFGRPIGKYQALQQQISVMTGHCHSAVMAAQLAASGMQRSDTGLSLDHHRVAAACGMIKAACQPVVSTAHAVHGAIGVTEEYELHHYTRRLLAGRVAGGSESRWFEQVGQACLDSDASVFDFTLASLS
ncbi:acyl-CoA dehydrogenase [Parahaliea maris]|uniref:Acyl-CoA dehydrogenase n=1 Tax=Parahaliea maris TaxID=2716870 RepID=A0A5C8ZMW1_9GAMM|nr:acyl-CoA dehydrogenase family protein [Parahaliea maris]TXS89833.1 acyl-CoA dehydrogenase [Parahaliea maris]